MDAFDKVIGYDEIKSELRRIGDVMKNPDKYWKLGVSISKGVLLYGEPGVGKTLIACCFMELIGRKKFTIRKDAANGDFVDHITDTFRKAVQNQPSIIFLDDIDKYSEDCYRNSDAEEYIAIQTGIDQIKEGGADVFCVGTCNDIENLPRSLIRAGRFDHRIEVNAPEDLSTVARIIEHYLKDKAVSEGINAHDIARLMEGKSCAELETVVNEAGILAGYEGKELIEQDDIIRACLRVIFDAPEATEGANDENAMRLIATHEAGHVVVAEMLQPGVVNVSSINKHTGNRGGITRVSKPESFETSFNLHEASILRSLAGKAAVEVVYGIPDIGAQVDLENAYNIVERFAAELHIYGFDGHSDYDDSEYWHSAKNHRITYELERYYRQARQIIVENRTFLDAVTDALIAKRTLTFKDIAEIRDRIEDAIDDRIFKKHVDTGNHEPYNPKCSW